jgi:predicted DNA-binding ribbon-helix-helix protein
MNERPNKRSVGFADGRNSSVNVEEPFWRGLKEIAALQGITLRDLLTSLDVSRDNKNPSSAIRVYVLSYYLVKLQQCRASSPPPPPA